MPAGMVRGSGLAFGGEGDDAGDPPLLPACVDFVLEHFDVVFGEVGEAALAEQVVADGLAPADAAGDGLGRAVENQLAIHDFVLDPDAGLGRRAFPVRESTWGRSPSPWGRGRCCG